MDLLFRPTRVPPSVGPGWRGFNAVFRRFTAISQAWGFEVVAHSERKNQRRDRGGVLRVKVKPCAQGAFDLAQGARVNGAYAMVKLGARD